MLTVQRDDLHDQLGKSVWVRAAEPARLARHGVDGDVLRIVERDVAVGVGERGAVEGELVEQSWRAVDAMGGEELVEERGGAIEQDGLRAEKEVWVLGFRVLIAVELVLGQDGLVEGVAGEEVCFVAAAVGERAQLVEVGAVEGVGVAEVEVGAREGEFLEELRSVRRGGVLEAEGLYVV